MGKIIVMSNTLNIKDTLNLVDGYIFGLKDYAVNFLNTYSIDELKEVTKLLKENNKEVFISMNRNIHSKEIDNLKEVLENIEKLNIDGILYADVCFVTLKEKMNLETKIIWNNEHLTTNYATINFWKNYNIDGAFISSDITFNEINEIVDNVDIPLMVQVFGYLPMFVSDRNIIDNYMNYFSLEGKSKINYMKDENNTYPIIDNKMGTNVFSCLPLNGYNEYIMLKDKVDYLVFNDFNIKEFNKILEIFKNESGEDELNKVITTSKHFLYKDTIYKVK